MSLPIQLRGVDVAVIPAYQPTGILLDLVREVTAAGCEVIVVNDGSSRASRPIFEQLKEMPDVTVLRHAVNAGKGAALKTAFRYIRDWKSPDTFIATMDADGQHLPADLQRVLLAARLHPGALVLGARTFGRGVPLRSRVGNKAACILFRAAGGPAGVTDTQTGLRAFGYPMLDSLLVIDGDGYEYEMNVLLHCRRRGIPIQEVPIRTLYLDEQNSSSHFHPLRDSWKVVKTMLRFASASLASFALDYGLFMILHGLTRGFGGGLLFSNVAARLGSGAFNYLLNRRLVFHDQGDPRRSLAGYLLLAAGILLANNAVLALYTGQLADVLLAACILLSIYYFHYLRPYRFELPASSPPAAQAAPGTMGAKFASQFSDTVVSTRDTYRSKDLAVTVTSHILKKSGDKDTRYYVADVYTSNIDCFKTYFAQNTYGSGFTEKITDMSADVGAVLAMNGDSYCYNHQHTAGSLIRNGVVYRAESTASDVCILYRDGVMRTYSPGQFDLNQVVRDGAYQSWTFGPHLLDDQGRAMTEFNTWDYIRESHPRSAVGYYEPGHYCFLMADGRSAQSSGMTLQEMSLVFEKLGCAAAYNLDGGHSAFLAFQGQVVNHPYRSSHQITDCLYFGEVP